MDFLQLSLLIFLLIYHFVLLDALFDLLLHYLEMVVVSLPILVLEGHFFQEHHIGVSHVWKQEHRFADAWGVEVDSQVGPLALVWFGNGVDSADVERHELLIVDWHQDCVILFVHVELTLFKIEWELLDRRVWLDLPHVFLFLLLRTHLNLVVSESLL